MAQITELRTGHEDEFAITGKRREDLAGEFPLMVLNEVVFLGRRELRVVFLVEERPRRREFDTEGELRTATRVYRVIDRRTGELQVQSEVMRGTIGDQQVRPILHHIHLITQFAVESEVVVRPAETLTITHRDTERTEVFILIRLRLRKLLVVVAVSGVVIVVGIGVIEVLVSALVAAGVTRLVGEIDTCAQAVRALTSEPRLQERDGGGGIIDTVRARVNREGLTLALRHDAVGFLVEEVLDGEVGKLETQRTYQTCSTPTERELNLVRGLGLQLVGDVHRSFFGIRLDIRHEFLLVEMAHLRQLTERTHDIRLRVELTGFGV